MPSFEENLKEILSKMIEESKTLRERAFFLDNKGVFRFQNARLSELDFVDDSNELFMLCRNPKSSYQTMEKLRTRLREKQIALEGKKYQPCSEHMRDGATSLVNAMLKMLDELTTSLVKLGVWQ